MDRWFSIILGVSLFYLIKRGYGKKFQAWYRAKRKK
jgi:hypothetical protein